MISFSASSSVNRVSSLFILSDSVLPSIHFSVITSEPLFILEKSSETSSTGPTESDFARFGSRKISPFSSEGANSVDCWDPDPYLASLPALPASCLTLSLYSSGKASLMVALCHISIQSFCYNFPNIVVGVIGILLLSAQSLGVIVLALPPARLELVITFFRVVNLSFHIFRKCI
jgi:hypothetical protein